MDAQNVIKWEEPTRVGINTGENILKKKSNCRVKKKERRAF
jgi:hypothetical protein